ncbi:hypothetical protein GCM10027037_18940 [Mucilaginibacter koreensis]
MKALRIFIIATVLTFAAAGITQVKAQCAMCSATADAGTQNGNTTANGLNNGIMYLLAAPYIAAAAVGFIWYKKYRRKNVDLKMRDEKLHLN